MLLNSKDYYIIITFYDFSYLHRSYLPIHSIMHTCQSISTQYRHSRFTFVTVTSLSMPTIIIYIIIPLHITINVSCRYINAKFKVHVEWNYNAYFNCDSIWFCVYNFPGTTYNMYIIDVYTIYRKHAHLIFSLITQLFETR